MTVDGSPQRLEIIDDRDPERATAMASQVPVDQWLALSPINAAHAWAHKPDGHPGQKIFWQAGRISIFVDE